MHGHVGVYLIGFATFNANLIKNSHKPLVRAIHLSNFWETSVILRLIPIRKSVCKVLLGFGNNHPVKYPELINNWLSAVGK
jgi:hypothetical protein